MYDVSMMDDSFDFVPVELDGKVPRSDLCFVLMEAMSENWARERERSWNWHH